VVPGSDRRQTFDDAAGRADRRYGRRPMGWAIRGKWLIGHVVVVLIAALFIRLGIWQLDRLQQRKDHNRLVEARMRATAVPVDAIPADPDAARYRATTVSGTYDAARQVIVRFRSNEGSPGTWVATPLRLSDGRGVVVLRGWVPEGAAATVVRPPTGNVTVKGLVDRTRLSPPDAIAVATLQEKTPYRLYPWFVQLTVQTPAPRDGLPDPLPAPDLGEGPHFSYAMQWFGFTLVGLVGWPLLIRREAERRRKRRSAANSPR
jgi:cytochrome oxidase assembly protein ShyY1